MVYRYPAQALWSSPQGKWKWDTEYVLEASIAAGQFAARLLAAAATTVVAASPAVPLTPEEVGRRGSIGFRTEAGAAEFAQWQFRAEGAE
jgi:hypothetical protein